MDREGTRLCEQDGKRGRIVVIWKGVGVTEGGRESREMNGSAFL